MKRIVQTRRTMTTPKKTIGSHVISVYSRSPTHPHYRQGGAAPEAEPWSSLGSVPAELPLPPHVDLDRVGQVRKVDYETRFRDAVAWADKHGIPRASEDSVRACLLLVDMQNTFCTPGFELFVAGRSGSGAVEDTKRLCSFLYRNLGVVTQAVVTLDTHQAFQIFHAPFLVDESGRHPDPYTLVTLEDVAGARWRVSADATATLGLDADEAAEHLRSYVETLAAGRKYELTIWPFHGLLGGIGHALVSEVEEAVFFHATARYSQTRFEIKGTSPLTEHYSALGPEVERGPRGEALAERNTALIEHLSTYDAVIVAGQAKSHCVAWTVEDLLDDVPEIAPRLYLLEDCSSPVVVPGVVDYTEEADGAFARFAEAGVHVVRSTEPLAAWPGPLSAALAR
jgi:nicotinamidase-related amidase